MNDSNSPFSSPPPIPTPDGNFTPFRPETTMDRGDWKSAPTIVKSWAYPLTWLGIIGFPLGIFGAWVRVSRSGVAALLVLILFVVLFAAVIWLNRNLKKGTSSAWQVQIAVSSFPILNLPISLFAFTRGGNPIGGIIRFAIHAYVLSQWFKPETKAWFGKS